MVNNHTYIAFDGDKDIHYYWLMKAWKYNQRDFFKFFDFEDAHDLNYARDTSQEDSIKRQLNVRLNQSNKFVLLVGESTKYLYKFVKWEIEQAIQRKLPLIIVNLNGKKHLDKDRCPSILFDSLALHVGFNQQSIERALLQWPNQYQKFQNEGKFGPFYYP